MTNPDFKPGDRVGVKDSPEFNHWSRCGEISAISEFGEITVKLDDNDAPVPVLPELLVPIGAFGTDEWCAQAFPVNGDAPGMKMYFANGAEIMHFVYQFRALQLDEVIKVHIPSTATDAERATLQQAGVQEITAS